ncbi:E3 ubiquitin-protein ligase MARCH3, partial [Trachymyrmex cornetzi]
VSFSLGGSTVNLDHEHSMPMPPPAMAPEGSACNLNGRDTQQVSPGIVGQQHRLTRSLISVGSSVCRICHTNTAKEPLISPCRCKGTLAYVHLSCLERWLNQSCRTYCELCRYYFNAVETPRYRCRARPRSYHFYGDQVSPWYRWWKSTVNVRLVVDPQLLRRRSSDESSQDRESHDGSRETTIVRIFSYSRVGNTLFSLAFALTNEIFERPSHAREELDYAIHVTLDRIYHFERCRLFPSRATSWNITVQRFAIGGGCPAKWSIFRGKHSLQIRVGDASRMTRNRDACRDPDESSTLLQAGLRSEEFLSQSSVLLGGSSDPLRTRRAQDADAAF